jgi:hypothetical protein
MALRAEADRIGVSFPALLTTDLVRYRGLASAAVPALDEWEWACLDHVLNGIDARQIRDGSDALISGDRIAAEIVTWADDAIGDELIRAEQLARKAAEWRPIQVAGALMHLRAQP